MSLNRFVFVIFLGWGLATQLHARCVVIEGFKAYDRNGNQLLSGVPQDYERWVKSKDFESSSVRKEDLKMAYADFKRYGHTLNILEKITPDEEDQLLGRFYFKKFTEKYFSLAQELNMLANEAREKNIISVREFERLNETSISQNAVLRMAAISFFAPPSFEKSKEEERKLLNEIRKLKELFQTK